MSKALRAAVVGVGYLGRFHAQKYASLDGVELVGVADARLDAAQRVAGELGVAAFADHRQLLGQVDLVSVACSTEHHHAVAKDFLAAGVHVLVEKPITVTVEQADELIGLAEAKHCVLQVGHLERFNPAWLLARDKIGKPMFIEAHRMAPFKPRGIDVSVVLDLMIHDIDLILGVVGSEVTELRASGVGVLTEGVDIANARLEFANGCVANLTVSRTSHSSLRRMRLFQRREYLSIDFQERRVGVSRKAAAGAAAEMPIVGETLEAPAGDALMTEIREFVASVRSGRPAVVSGLDGRRALALALLIDQTIQQRLHDFPE